MIPLAPLSVTSPRFPGPARIFPKMFKLQVPLVPTMSEIGPLAVATLLDNGTSRESYSETLRPATLPASVMFAIGG